jgi:acyl-coenzyme A thioesterase PaaI-like protein
MIDSLPPIDAVNNAMRALVPAAERLGITVVELGPGRAVCELPLKGNTNHLGVMYAGSMFVVAELVIGALGVASIDMTRYAPVVAESRIEYHRKARTDVHATATFDIEQQRQLEQTCAQQGALDLTFDVPLTDANEDLVATAHTTVRLRDLHE